MLVARRGAGILLHSLTKVDVTETAASDLAADAVLVPHAEVLHSVSDVVLAGCTAASFTRSAVACRAVGGHAPLSSCLWLTSRMRIWRVVLVESVAAEELSSGAERSRCSDRRVRGGAWAEGGGVEWCWWVRGREEVVVVEWCS